MKMVTVSCEYCGTVFETTIYEQRRFESGKKKSQCCSRECARNLFGRNHSGKNNPKYVEKIKQDCEFCGREYEIYNDQVGISRFCGKGCQDNSRRKDKIELTCKNCGDPFYESQGNINFWGDVRAFCSNKCATSFRKKRVRIKCLICGTPFETQECYKDIRITCSKKCMAVWQSTIYSKLPEVQERLKKQGTTSQQKSKNKFTLPEKLVYEYFTKHNIPFIFQFPMNSRCVIDFYFPELNLTLEIYGDYWHSNPNKYGDDKKELNETQTKIKSRDIRKEDYLINECGCNFYSIWEHDIKTDLENTMNEFLDYYSKIRRESVVS